MDKILNFLKKLIPRKVFPSTFVLISNFYNATKARDKTASFYYLSS